MGITAIIADDLTGATDTGVQFCKYGLRTIVINQYQELKHIDPNKEVWAINADTRPLTAAAAYERTYRITNDLKSLGINQIYKKIDSTLRGHPGTELEAVMDALEVDIALLTPAFPGTGRMVRGGQLYLAGKKESVCNIVPVIQGQMKRSVVSIKLETVRGGVQQLVQEIMALKSNGSQVFVLDAVTEEDLITITQVTQLITNSVAVGAAGLAAFLPTAWGYEPPVNRAVTKAETTLLIAGSQNQVTRRQMQSLLAQMEVPVVKVDTNAILRGQGPAEVQRAIELANSFLNNQQLPQLVVISVDGLLVTEQEDAANEVAITSYHSEDIAAALGQIARELVLRGQIHSIIATGGDTALHVCGALAANGIELITELLPGIPIGRLAGGIAKGMPIVTKSGGFGEPSAFVTVNTYLRNHVY
ncbi:MAG: four-carbon acid sugar kinase family protein [Bacillota bacterium]|nr:four-carbon acid sugar kinase family protein [Bacillota bacterium]